MRLRHAASGIFVASLAALCTLAGIGSALRSGFDSPDNGVEQVGRGSAWVARADDPLAAFYNPAAIAFQATSVHLGATPHVRVALLRARRRGRQAHLAGRRPRRTSPDPARRTDPRQRRSARTAAGAEPAGRAHVPRHRQVRRRARARRPACGAGEREWLETLSYTNQVRRDRDRAGAEPLPARLEPSAHRRADALGRVCPARGSLVRRGLHLGRRVGAVHELRRGNGVAG